MTSSRWISRAKRLRCDRSHSAPTDFDPDAIPQFGLVAEDVENVNPDLVAKDEEGKPYTVRYEAVNAMLLNEFLKRTRRWLRKRTKTKRKKQLLAN